MPRPGPGRVDHTIVGNVVFRSELARYSDERVVEALIGHGASALIAPRRPAEHLLGLWAAGHPGRRFLAYSVGVPPPGHSDLVEYKLPDAGLRSVAAALAHFERAAAFDRFLAEPAAVPAPASGAVLVGAGIVNLIVALSLAAFEQCGAATDGKLPSTLPEELATRTV
jgi:hypothetical protein